MDIVKGNMGWIEVIVGPMFSGKSEELIRRLRRAEIGKQRVQIFKPVIDQRYAKNGIVSHSGLEIPSELVQSGTDILESRAAHGSHRHRRGPVPGRKHCRCLLPSRRTRKTRDR